MTRQEAREFLITISYKLGNMSVEYLSEKDGEKMRDAISILLEQDPILDKIKAEIEEHIKINQCLNIDRTRALCWCLDVIDKYKSEGSEER